MARKERYTPHGALSITGSPLCMDKAIYYQDNLVGAITLCGDRWCVWGIPDNLTIDDPCQLSRYTDRMDRLAAFRTYPDAKVYVRHLFRRGIQPPAGAEDRHRKKTSLSA
jgi:hypothetical protein